MNQNMDQLYQEWLSLQPLKPEDQLRLDRKFMLEFNYNSNHIEGNTLTYGQTEMLLLFGKVVDDSTMKDLEEMKAHSIALKMVQSEAQEKEIPLTETFIRQLHHTLLREDYVQYRQLPDGNTTSYTIHAGIYKTRPNSVITVTGERFEYASPEETPALMKDLVDWYNLEEEKNELTPIKLASIFHYRYIRIHPFEDGNGRIARLLVNYILLRHNYPMIVVESKNKDAYLTALNKCDVAVGPVPSVGAHAEYEQLIPFVQYMEQCMVNALTICVKAAKGENISEEDDFAKQIALLKRNTKKKDEEIALEETPESKAKVFNDFHREYTRRLLSKIDLVKSFYKEFDVEYYFGYQNPIAKTTKKMVLSVDQSLDVESKEVMENIDKSNILFFSIKLDKVVPDYKIKDHNIYITAHVLFFNDHYVFNDKEYNYRTYPSKQEQDNLIAEIESDILKRIQHEAEGC